MNIIIAITLFFAYTLILCVANKKIPQSLSKAVLALPQLGTWVWTLFIGAISALCFPTLINTSSEPTFPLAFITLMAMLTIAVCPLDQQKHKDTTIAHTIATYVAIICSQLIIIMNKPILLLLWLPYLAAAAYIYKRKEKFIPTFWIEITCFITIFAYCLLQ